MSPGPKVLVASSLKDSPAQRANHFDSCRKTGLRPSWLIPATSKDSRQLREVLVRSERQCRRRQQLHGGSVADQILDRDPVHVAGTHLGDEGPEDLVRRAWSRAHRSGGLALARADSAWHVHGHQVDVADLAVPVPAATADPPAEPAAELTADHLVRGYRVEIRDGAGLWRSLCVHASGPTRVGGGLRVYLDRPWCVSGEGELLGVVLQAGTPLDAKVCSRCGLDAAWEGKPSAEAVLLEPHHFTNAVERKAVTLAEGNDAIAVGFEPEWDGTRRLCSATSLSTWRRCRGTGRSYGSPSCASSLSRSPTRWSRRLLSGSSSGSRRTAR